MAIIKCPSCGKTISDTDDCRYCGLPKSEFAKATYTEPKQEVPPEPKSNEADVKEEPGTKKADKEEGSKTVIMIRCRKCGKAIPEDAAFCQYCGEPTYPERQMQQQEDVLPLSGLRLVLSVVLIVVAAFAAFQSTLVLLVNSTEGGVGICLAMVMLICGIIGLVTRKDNTGKFSWGCGCFLITFGVIAVITKAQSFPDLTVWGVLSVICGLVFCAAKMQKGR